MHIRQSVTVTKPTHARHGQAGTVEGFGKVGTGKNRTDGVTVRFHSEGDPDEGEAVTLPLGDVKPLSR